MLRHKRETLQEQALAEAQAAGGIAGQPLRLLTPWARRRQRLKWRLEDIFGWLVLLLMWAAFIAACVLPILIFGVHEY